MYMQKDGDLTMYVYFIQVGRVTSTIMTDIANCYPHEKEKLRSSKVPEKGSLLLLLWRPFLTRKMLKTVR
jgi:hypothetical protein